MCRSRKYSHPIPMHGQSLKIPKDQEEGALKEKTSTWGMDLFSKKTMSEKSLITKYGFNKYLTCQCPLSENLVIQTVQFIHLTS